MTSSYIPAGYHFDTQHDGTEHLAINNTFARRFLTRLALHTTAKFYSEDGLCVPISKHKIVKAGHRTHLTEAYIVMERIQGDVLPKAWKGLSEESLEGIFTQLRKIFQELRALTPPPGMTGVESCVGGSLYDSRIPRGKPRFGPFKTIQDFHFWLRHDFKPDDLKRREEDQDSHDLRDMMSKQDGSWPLPKFSHGDLNPFNVIVRGGNVVGVIDWEFAGWYPYYWEYTSAWFGNLIRTDWQGMIGKFLDRPSPEEFKMEEVRHKWWGEF
ncbi:kinase-like protein [Dothidotthia symphoricarpi CBS 119687]|uniref:Kinase-like protein n=1 Tax=Dothidotthia symphoricarpi CBS 119687 TaxID=1392245 RepID=A0A6A5ZZ72_9PLEO|nr:kinase-like protein [Dothidotthia symphoricarpi CBS 119687]KAF2124869.1 kinase-like protein [Dothidotthia symphoricarpi CBS 119687]